MFALRVLVLVAHGYHGERLFAIVSNLKLNHAMTRVIVIKRPRSKPIALARLRYASSVWWGFATVGEHKRLNSILRKMTRPGFLSADVPSFDKHCSRAYSTLFRSNLLNPSHFQFIHIIKSYFSQI